MKFVILVLKASIVILLLSLGVYIAFFCVGKDGIDPIETETIGMVIYTGLGVLFSSMLIRRVPSIRGFWFGLGFVFYLFVWTFPAIFMACYTLLMMMAG
jgi:hypothetical protein